MIVALLLLLAGRSYHGVSIAQLAASTHTHVAVCGTVTLVKHEGDGDWHIRLSDGKAFVVAEVIEEIPLPIPRVGQVARVAGISRIDKAHGSWPEVHPVTAITIVRSCSTP